ncbi:MAG: hypothetical protein JRE57_17840 [Deltaproteobacteria bacterium]|nr:hypothetical protein [Deltaproteobacteria bacterium]
MYGALQLKPISLFLGLLVPLWASSAAAQDEYGQAPDFHTLEEVPEGELPKGIPIELRVRSDTRFIVGSDFGPEPPTSLTSALPLQTLSTISTRAHLR